MESGALDLVSLPTLAIDPLAEFVGRLRAAHPGLMVRVAEADGGIAALVRAGRAEIGLTELPTAAGDLIEARLADQELMAIGGPSGVSDLRWLATLPLILAPPGTSSRGVVIAALTALGIDPFVGVEVESREAVVPLVLAGAGVGFVPTAQAESARAQGATATRTTPPLVRKIGLLHRPGRLSPAASAFLALSMANRIDR
jgi:DNA-binding transcriptional LysR family regulator